MVIADSEGITVVHNAYESSNQASRQEQKVEVLVSTGEAKTVLISVNRIYFYDTCQ